MATRDVLIARLRERLERHGLPRLTILLALVVAGGTAFFTAILLLGGGLTTMAIRYPVAGLAGYLAFILIIRLWIAWQRRSPSLADGLDALDVANVVEIPSPLPRTGDAAIPLARGGRSGGAGASGSWGQPAEAGPARAISADAGAGVFDTEELSFAVVLCAVTFAGLIAVGYVVYVAPLLLAEVALDAALVSTLYGRLRREETRSWAGTLLRRTWLPAAALIATLAIGGFIMQLAAPGAVSIGGVIAALAE